MRTFRDAPSPTDDDFELAIIKLIQVSGIARKTAEALYELGIRSYASLIDYASQHTAEEISAALKMHGVNRSPGLINRETWIREAEALNRKEYITSSLPESEVEPGKPAEPISDIGSREHYAVFTVSFEGVREEDGELILYTTVYDEGNAGEEIVFVGSDTSQWVSWILKRADLPPAIEGTWPQVEAEDEAPLTPVEPAVPPVSEDIPEFDLEIGDVKIIVIEHTLEVPERRLKAEIDFKLSGPGAEIVVSKRLLFRIEIYAIDVDSGFPMQVASREVTLEPNIIEYSYQLEFAIPVMGRYEFHSVIRSIPSGELRSYHRGPTIGIRHSSNKRNSTSSIHI